MKPAFTVGILTVVILVLLISGCSSDTTYTPPAKVEQAAQPAQAQPPASDAVQTTPSEPKVQVQQPTASEPPKVTIFKVGEIATDGELKFTVNSVKYVKVIDEKNNEFMTASAPKGYEYLIIDFTVENVLPDKTQNVAPNLDTEVVDQEGYVYRPDFSANLALVKNFAGEVLPGMKKRGEVAFEVPINATDLKFIYKFDLFTGTSAVFDIK